VDTTDAERPVREGAEVAMSVFETESAGGVQEAAPAVGLETPFPQALATVGEAVLETSAVQALAAELEDVDLTEALEKAPVEFSTPAQFPHAL
jgi:hypothetical protein